MMLAESELAFCTEQASFLAGMSVMITARSGKALVLSFDSYQATSMLPLSNSGRCLMEEYPLLKSLEISHKLFVN